MHVVLGHSLHSRVAEEPAEARPLSKHPPWLHPHSRAAELGFGRQIMLVCEIQKYACNKTAEWSVTNRRAAEKQRWLTDPWLIGGGALGPSSAGSGRGASPGLSASRAAHGRHRSCRDKKRDREQLTGGLLSSCPPLLTWPGRLGLGLLLVWDGEVAQGVGGERVQEGRAADAQADPGHTDAPSVCEKEPQPQPTEATHAGPV